MAKRGAAIDLVRLGANIRVARRNLGLSQASLAKKVSVAQGQISKWETGRDQIMGGNLAVLAAALRQPSDVLLHGVVLAKHRPKRRRAPPSGRPTVPSKLAG